jgi:hypothetical protein
VHFHEAGRLPVVRAYHGSQRQLDDSDTNNHGNGMSLNSKGTA